MAAATIQSGIPSYIKLKHVLLKWFENMQSCPLKYNGDFPAWAGYKRVTAAGPAVTTPDKGLAGFQTMSVRGLCPQISSTDFECVRTKTEVKARAKRDIITITLGGLSCKMRDISLYKMDSGFVGVRFDFPSCQGISHMSSSPVRTASMNAALTNETLTNGSSSAQFSNFFKAVCDGAPPADFLTTFLPKFLNLGGKKPTCFAQSTHAEHVIGKGCFADFLFMDLMDLTGELAKIPAQDLQGLVSLIPGTQSYP
jgi:hypothetical protein